MEEPKRRLQRVQREPGEMHVPDESGQEAAAPDTTQEAHEHRRRRQTPMEEKQEPVLRELKEQKNHKNHKKKSHNRHQRAMQQLSLGAALLLGMLGAAAAKAAKKIRREHIRLAAMAVCTCVALFSAWQVGSIVLRSVRTNKLNQELAQQRASIIEAQQAQTTESEMTPALQMDEEPFAGPETTPEADESQIEESEIEEFEIDESEIEESDDEMPAATKTPDIVKMTKYRRLGGDPLPEMAQLHQQNRDLVAWIQIPDVLDLPVVYRDNDYYLTRDFSKQKNASGTIFLDVNHPFKEKTQNLLLHGHNMKDGTMFGRLAQYLYDDSYLRNHPFIYFDTLWHKEQYVIVGVLNVSLEPGNERFFNYFTHDTFSSDAEFSMYVRQLQLRSRYAIPIDVRPSDALLTLSTCLDDDRLVIVARRLRENETRTQLRTLIRMATKQ